MDVFWCLPLTLLLLHQATCTNDRAEVTRATGRSVTFFLKNLDGEAAAWSFHDDVIVTVKFGNPPEAIFLDQKYKPRLTFPKNGSALTISQLTTDDAGTYTAKTSGIKTTFTLHVYRELAVPTVTCMTQNCSADGCLYTLRCAVSGSGYGDVSYSWSMGDLLWREGPTVVVEESPPGEPPPLLTCVARNPVSSRNTSLILPAALCAENTTHLPTAGAYSSRWAGIVVTSLIGAGLLLAVLIFMICYKSKGWRIFSLPAAEVRNVEAVPDYTTVYAQVGPSQQLCLQSVSNAQQNDAKRSPTPSKPLYFTIQSMGQTDDEKMGNGALGCQEQDEKTIYSLVS